LAVLVESTEFDIDKVDFEFLLSLDANEKRTALARRDDFIGIMNALEENGVRALEFPHDKLCELRKVNVSLLLVEDVFRELGNTFGICLRFESVSLVLQDGFQFAVIGDNAVVHDDKLGLGITPAGLKRAEGEMGPVRMTIEGRGLAVRCPSCVRDSGVGHKFLVHVDVLFVDQLAQGSNLADLLEQVDFILAVAVNGHSGGIIATVLETLKA
jgi:hypothetical protein